MVDYLSYKVAEELQAQAQHKPFIGLEHEVQNLLAVEDEEFEKEHARNRKLIVYKAKNKHSKCFTKGYNALAV